MSNIFDILTVPVVSKLPSIVHWQSGADSTMKPASNEGARSVKWADLTENDWKDESKSEENPEPETRSDKAQDDDDFSVTGEDEILER